MDNEPAESSATNRYFTESGNCDDEVTLNFDDDTKLFVSRNFLRYASPVFEAMFTSDFIEKEHNSVDLKGKDYEDVLEFLLCVHPRILKDVTETNVLRVAPLAEEYQVTSVIEICHRCMEAILSRSVEKASSKSCHLYHAEPLKDCIEVLTTAVHLNCEDLVEKGVKTIAKFGHIHYIRNHPNPGTSYSIAEETRLSFEKIGMYESFQSDSGRNQV